MSTPGDREWRLFLALWPPPGVLDGLVRLQQSWSWTPGAAPVRPGRLHLTLHFIGPVPARRMGELREGLHVPFEPFVLDTEAAVPQLWRGGTAVLELGTPPALLRLHAALADALRELDLPVDERPYRPHVTFARKAMGSQPPASIPALTWPAGEGYALVRTVPGRGYEIQRGYR